LVRIANARIVPRVRGLQWRGSVEWIFIRIVITGALIPGPQPVVGLPLTSPVL
jgi:hypothetical protein